MEGIEISNDIFQDYKLNKCNLEAIALRFCTINNNNILDSQIIRSIFDNTTIDKCNFDKIVFEESGFSGGEIKKSCFIEVKFIRGDLSSVLIKDCNNTGLELDSMYLDEPFFEKNIFINSKWSDLLIERTNFCGNNFKNSLFYNGQISNSTFDDNNFEGSEWNNVVMYVEPRGYVKYGAVALRKAYTRYSSKCLYSKTILYIQYLVRQPRK